MGDFYEYDVFISHSDANRELVIEHVVKPLCEAGFSVHRYPDFTVGSTVVTEIDEGIRKSRRFLVVYTKECPQSAYVQDEIEGALKRDRDEKTHTVSCIVYGDVKRPAVLDKYVLLIAKSENELDEKIQVLVRQWERDPVPLIRLNHGGSVLAVGAHWDDILLGCLGSLIKLAKVFKYHVDLLVLCTTYGSVYYGEEQTDLDTKARRFYKQIEKECKFTFLNDSMLKQKNGKGEDLLCDGSLSEKESFIRSLLTDIIKGGRRPGQRAYNLIMCPPMDDMNEDHAVVGRAVFSQFGRTKDTIHTVLEYPVKKYTDRLFVPNLCISLDDDIGVPSTPCSVADKKIQIVRDVCRITDNVVASGRLFAEDVVRARMNMSTVDYAKNRAVKYVEVFRGEFEL